MPPTIGEITGLGPKLNECQRSVMDLLEAHPERLFGTDPYDLGQLQDWLLKPKEPKPPGAVRHRETDPRHWPLGALREALLVLEKEGLIASTEVNGKLYYGSLQAVMNALPAKGSRGES